MENVGTGSSNFPKASCKSLTWVLKISTLPLNSLKMEITNPKFYIFDGKFPHRNKKFPISQHFRKKQQSTHCYNATVALL